MIGKHVRKTGSTNFDVNVECMRSVQTHTRGQHVNPRQQTDVFFLTDGRITFSTWDRRMITDPFVMEVSLQEDSDFEKNDKTCVFTAVDPLATWILASSIKMEMEMMAQCSNGFDMRFAQKQRIGTVADHQQCSHAA